MDDVDIFEINEAFASQVSLCFAVWPGAPSWSQGARGKGDQRGVHS